MSKKGSSSKKEAQATIEKTEAEIAQDALKEIQKNSQSVLKEGSELPKMFQGMPVVLPDPTSPIVTDSETMASNVLNVIPSPQENPPVAPNKKQSREMIKNLAVKCSADLGVVLDQAHMDDLYHISSSALVDERFVWAYLRGVSITNQISATTALTKLVKDIETAMSKTQQYISQGMDSNKLLSERITMQGQKVEQIIPAVGSLVKAEHGITRDLVRTEIKKGYGSMKVVGESSKAAVTSQETSGQTPPFPGPDEIAKMCAVAEVPEANIPTISSKYAGKVTWKEYTSVISGTMTKKDARALIISLKTRL